MTRGKQLNCCKQRGGHGVVIEFFAFPNLLKPRGFSLARPPPRTSKHLNNKDEIYMKIMTDSLIKFSKIDLTTLNRFVNIISAPASNSKGSIIVEDEELDKDKYTDRVAWFIMKIAMNLSEFLSNPNEENYKILIGRLRELESIKIDASSLEKAVEKYLKKKDDDSRTDLIYSFHRLIKIMIKQSCQ
uniref:Uncharacterized protein n=1 Tax=Sulfolobus neozealandicus TaxID=299422 RepID=Q5DVF0_9CREN|nr:hypothetical protein [Sulfolobus neozealandicus]